MQNFPIFILLTVYREWGTLHPAFTWFSSRDPAVSSSLFLCFFKTLTLYFWLTIWSSVTYSVTTTPWMSKKINIIAFSKHLLILFFIFLGSGCLSEQNAINFLLNSGFRIIKSQIPVSGSKFEDKSNGAMQNLVPTLKFIFIHSSLIFMRDPLQ